MTEQPNPIDALDEADWRMRRIAALLRAAENFFYATPGTALDAECVADLEILIALARWIADGEDTPAQHPGPHCLPLPCNDAQRPA